MAISDFGKTIATTGLSVASASGLIWYSVANKAAPGATPVVGWKQIMIGVSCGLTLFVLGSMVWWWGERKEKREAANKDKARDDKEKVRDEATQGERNLDRKERADERREDKLERQREREEEQKRLNLDAVAAKERADKERTERDKSEEADRVRADQRELDAIQKLNGCPQTDAYKAFIQANRMCGNGSCKTMFPRRQFIRNDLVDRHNWLTCVCIGCATRLWPQGRRERMWPDDYNSQVNRK